ncbi:S26 family signal peptidase [Blastopirellula marina]|uniref:Peptidase S26 domain-containing protein n=1 Tax=Blastopirellula marina TaxID=124 RepID=A0A2S8FHI3_9BACT|nr:S26 family signal peptidase [Blastopirellula marina]PQO31603.1 hypothetical protein C5Y98_19500 [Blastopirellula marina]PTL42910.1 hypothetical protein C5Y97_19510 [Blastopirellula marina]
MRLGPFVVLLIAAVGVICFQAANLPPDPIYRVASGSMAPHLPGPHVMVRCDHCQFQAMVDGTVELPAELTCPNCGQASPTADSPVLPGRTIQWKPVAADELQRFDVVLLQTPSTPPSFAVKRIAFLPGESPRIEDGELYQNGSMIRKPSRQRETMKLLVFDQSHQASDNDRFLSQLPVGSGWDVRPGVLAFAPLRADKSEEGDWLIYHHRSCLPPPSPSDRDMPPKDSYGYNHALSRELFPANDLWLEWKFRHWNAKALVLKLQGTDVEASICIDFEKQVVRAQSSTESVELPLEVTSLTGVTVRAGKCDGMLFLEMDQGAQHWTFPLIATDLAFSAQPFAIQVQGGPAVLKQAKVYRDIVWLGGHGRTSAWSLDSKLAPHEIFVLGDNAPISDDSRGERGPIDIRKYLQGKLLRVQSD